jgi:hypothetical protein
VTIWFRLSIDAEANKKHFAGIDGGQFYVIAASWCVKEIAISGVDSIVAEVVEDN